MARYKITTLNYITAGKTHAFINVDAALDYTRPTKVNVLYSEDEVSAITLDQGNIEYINTEYIKKEDQTPLSFEQGLNQTIVLKEDQKYIKNIEAQDKSLILLKTSADFKDKISALKEFQSEMSSIANLTFELETENNDFRNNMTQQDIGKQLLPMYDIRNMSIKSSNKKKMANRLYYTGKYVDLYAPTMLSGPMKFCEANGYSYMLIHPTNDSPQSLNAYVNDNEDSSYYMQIRSRALKTYAYSPLGLLNYNAIKDGQIGDYTSSYAEFFKELGLDLSSAMSMLFSPKYNYSNIKYNYILDFDQNGESLFYDEGDLYTANINLAKNIYDSSYTMEMANEDEIIDTREYCSIGSMNNRVFLTFIDDIKQEALTHRHSNEADIVDVAMKSSNYEKVIYVEKKNQQ